MKPENRGRGRTTTRVFQAAALAAATIVSSAARAAPPDASSTGPLLRAPRPFGALDADYPKGAHGDADVTLEVTIDASGVVVSARPLLGAEPFASAAVAGSSAWRFAPATRGDEPVAARVRAIVHFVEEVARTDAIAADERPAERPVTPSAAEPRPLEVTVHGQLPVPASASLSRAEVRLLPGAFGDPFRAIESMPGVTPLASGIPYFYVRGAPPGNVGYYVDSVRVPILFHLGLGPSVIHPALIDRVDLYEGGYPAQYGRFAGAIVAGETKPPLAEWHGEANIRLVDAGALVEAPFADGKGTALVGGRYGYTTLLLKLIAPDVDLDYADYQARASYRLSAHDQISAFAFGSWDHWATKQDGVFQTLFDTQFHRLDLRYDRVLEGGGTLRQAVTLGVDRTGLDDGQYVFDRMIAARTEVEMPVTAGARVRFGVDMTMDATSSEFSPAETDVQLSALAAEFPPRDDLTVGVRGDVVLQLGPRLEVTPGVRVDLYLEGGVFEVGFDPRLAARLAVTKDVRLVQAYGVASQPPSFFLPGPGLSPALTGGLQRAFQTSASIEVDLPAEITASVGEFHDAFFNMTDALSISTPGTLPTGSTQRANGHAYGLEVSVKRDLTKRVGGFLSYTLSRSVRTAGAFTAVSAFDRTHVLDAAVAFDFGRGYHAGARAIFYTGNPAVQNYTTAGYSVGSVYTGSRLPPFFRLDLRFEKRWELGKRRWLSFVVEVLNATFTKETVGVDCAAPSFSSATSCENQVIGP
ncbi:MAG TPA: TonB-dependent receptor plug domain-containing protein, partial [Byssovorax sp.]